MDYLHDTHRSMFLKLLPSAIGAMLSETVASLIDTIILSHYLGPDMLSTISICMPIYMFVNVLSMLIVSGGAALTVVGLLFTQPIVSALGANGEVLDPTVRYAKVLFGFMIPLSLYQQLMVYVRFDGAPMLSLASTVVCAVVNLALDVLFVGPLGWGPGGAALATCLAYTVAMLINACRILQKGNGLVLRRGSLTGERIKRLLKTGIPLSVTQLGMAAAILLYIFGAGFIASLFSMQEAARPSTPFACTRFRCCSPASAQ